ncbi:hypothetical protein JW826_03700 [Candidatus Woesearchaeota archaeon]|nr:hypothetical protein [Candidatus Woesearchaeota archaeon]
MAEKLDVKKPKKLEVKKPQGPGDKGEEAPKIDFDKISSALKKLEDRNHIDQIGPSVTDAYIGHAKFTDENGVVRYKTKFDQGEAEKLADKVYDQLVYHTHRRFFNMDQEKLDSLKGIKDAQGNSYVDTVVRYHFDLDRSTLRKSLKTRAENDDKIDHNALQEMLEDKVRHHAGIITGDILKDIEPKDMDALKAYIKELGDRHKLDEKVVKKAQKTYDIQSLIKQYMNIVQHHYSEPKKEEKKAA